MMKIYRHDYWKYQYQIRDKNNARYGDMVVVLARCNYDAHNRVREIFGVQRICLIAEDDLVDPDLPVHI